MGVLAKHAQTRQVSDMGCPSEYKSVSTKEGKILRIVVSIAAVIVFLWKMQVLATTGQICPGSN